MVVYSVILAIFAGLEEQPAIMWVFISLAIVQMAAIIWNSAVKCFGLHKSDESRLEILEAKVRHLEQNIKKMTLSQPPDDSPDALPANTDE